MPCEPLLQQPFLGTSHQQCPRAPAAWPVGWHGRGDGGPLGQRRPCSPLSHTLPARHLLDYDHTHLIDLAQYQWQSGLSPAPLQASHGPEPCCRPIPAPFLVCTHVVLMYKCKRVGPRCQSNCRRCGAHSDASVALTMVSPIPPLRRRLRPNRPTPSSLADAKRAPPCPRVPRTVTPNR